jgi:hypothetical protein
LRLVAAIAVLVLASPAWADRWTLAIPERVEVVAGTSSVLPIAIELDRGLSVSKDAAVILDLAPDAAIAIKKRRLGRADAVDPDAAAPKFSVPLRADTAGDFSVRVHLRFWVCGQRACRPVEARRNVAIAVTTATAPCATPTASSISPA